MLSEICPKCKDIHNEDVKLFKIEFFIDGSKNEEELKKIIGSCESTFCLVPKCDDNL
jgi:hypothetical protein